VEANDAPPPGRRYRIAVVGAGLIGRRHIDLVRRDPVCALTAVVDPDPAAEALAAQSGAPWHATLDGLLIRAGLPDGVIIATPSSLHREHAERCIAAGIPILVEKPIATTVEDGLGMAETAARHAVPLLVGHHRRHSPVLAAAREVIATGALGDLVAVSATTMFAKPEAYFQAAPWRRQPGGGPILINLIHDIDALRFLVGDVASVQAMAATHVRGHPVEETVSVNLQFANGALGSLLLSDTAASPLSWELTAGEDPSFPQQRGHDSYLLAGTRGSLGIPTLRLMTYDGEPSWQAPMRTSIVPVQTVDPLARQLDHFRAVIERREAPLVTGWDAVESLRVTLAVVEAARTGDTVRCAPPDLDSVPARS
jgi:predicted dehydrogenase